MNEAQIKIGTSSWGSKIGIKDAINLGEKIIDLGLNSFDTAPNYGSGYSHYILNQIGEKKEIFIDTKYGQNIELTFKEFLKRLYRFNNLKSFKRSFKNIKINNRERNDDSFWDLNKIEQALYTSIEDLYNCNIQSFYLHSPPHGVLNTDYLNEFLRLFEQKKILLGISEPDVRDLMLIVKNFPSINLQISLDTFWKNKNDLISYPNNIIINGIFRKLKNDDLQNNKTKNIFFADFLDILEKKKNYKIILGINSYYSFEKLKKIIKDFSNIN